LLDFVSKRNWFFLVSGLFILAGIIALAVSGLNLGIEFRSGTTMTLIFEEPVDQAALRTALTDLGQPQAQIQHSSKDAFLVQGVAASPEERQKLLEALQAKFGTTTRIVTFGPAGNTTAGNTTAGNETLAIMLGTGVAESELSDAIAAAGYPGAAVSQKTLDSYLVRAGTISTDRKAQMQQALEPQFGPMNFLDFASISAGVAGERVRYNIYAMIAAAVGVLIYMIWAFRKLAGSFRYGVCAILALVHDILIMLAVFALFRIEIDSMFIIAILTVIGFGVNNIIVVFDRLRESKSLEGRVDLATRVNMGITETISRSINTSLTVLFACFALYAFGGSTIHSFMLALIVGIIASTYSSLFIAGQLLVAWDSGDIGRLFRWLPLRRRES